MHSYLTDTEFAAKSLIDTIYNEEINFQRLSAQFNRLKNHFDVLHWDFSTADGSEDFNDFQIQDKFIRMAKFHKDNDIEGKKKELDEIQHSLTNKKYSIDSLSMSLLQIAKQGISTVHGQPANCPPGRNIGSEVLKNVIWQGRNQSIHCEEGNPNARVSQCFANLTNDFGPDFDITIKPTENKAKVIVDKLGWTNYEDYKNDMISIIG
jgi:hypothetical protein